MCDVQMRSVIVRYYMTVRHDILEYKLSPAFAQRVGQLAVDSKVTFDNFSTPGWSSLMHTENSPQGRQKNDHQTILDKLNRLKDEQGSENVRSRIRLPDSSKGSNVLIYEEQKHLLKASSRRSERPSSAKQNLNTPSNLHTTASVRPSKRPPSDPSLKNSYLSHKNKPSGLPPSHQTRSQTQIMCPQGKRFKQITVHEHLYLAGIKQSNKRVIEQVLEEQYLKEKVTPFQPRISIKSQQLAEIKFSRIQERQELEQVIEAEVKKEENKVTRTEQRVKNGYQVVQKMFIFLSASSPLISKETLKAVEQQLPLICIRALQKVLQKIYSGATYTWLQFLSQLNNKKMVSNKAALITIFQKWQSRSRGKS